jgi:transposase InsO family protein
MAAKVRPPDYSKAKSYERYKIELKAWREITELPKTKQGIAIALSLPEENDIREQVFDCLSIDTLKDEKGFESLIDFLDKKLGKDDLSDSWEKFNDFEEFERKNQVSIKDYIDTFDLKYSKLNKMKLTLPSPILAFKLLKSSNISKTERMLVLTGMDYTNADNLYEQAKKSLLKFKGSQNDESSGIKLEAAFVAEEDEQDEVYWTAGARGGRGRNWNGSRNGGNWNGDKKGRNGGNWNNRDRNWNGGNRKNGGYRENWRSRNEEKWSGGTDKHKEKHLNPIVDGKPLLCRSCGSYRHLMASCPDSYENTKQSVNMVQDNAENEIVFFTGYNKLNLGQLSVDARNCAVLDTACSSTVCGDGWMKSYLSSLNVEDLEKVVMREGEKIFKFGAGEQIKSKASYSLPVVLAGKPVTLITDVVDSDIPLLLSKNAMKGAKVKLNLENDTAEIFGVQVMLNHTTSGHYCVPIDKNENIPVESVCAVKLFDLDNEAQYRSMVKLHRQFGHPPQEKLKILLKDAGAWVDGLQDCLERVYEKCELCKMYKKTPPRPVVARPMASRFNEKVAMDLKKWRGRWILHLVDMWSRFSVSVFIERKRPTDVIDKIMKCWIGAGFGVMEAILTDNGGEFNNDEMREVCSILNVEICTTAADSPFQNGLCERNHAVTDSMLLKMEEQCAQTPIDVLLCWANMAKNSLQMWHGYSSYQLVFGKNPNLPNVMGENLPALQGKTNSEILATHLNSLHAARKAFIESETSERVRRALRSKVRASEQRFEHGDRVYYKRDQENKWLGPGKVMFQDGCVVFVRHGGTFVRVSPNRLIKAGEEIFHKPDKCENNRGEEFEDTKVKTKENCSGVYEILGKNEQSTEQNEVNDENIDVNQIDANGHDMGTGQNLNLKKNDMIRYRVSEQSDWIDAEVLGRGGKITGKHKNWYNVKNSDGLEKSINVKEIECQKKDLVEEVYSVLIPKSEQNSQECKEAKQVELDKLKKFDTYLEVDDVDQFRISTTWVLCRKESGVRARLVARGFEDTASFRKDSPTLGKGSLRVILSIAASMGWILKTTDIKSAFLQGKKMDREVYITPPKEADVPKGKLWKLLHCLYGLNDAARHFYQSVVETLKNLGCVCSSLDPALFFFRRNGKLEGIVASHVDDFLHAGSEYFDKIVMSKLRDRFLAGKLEESKFKYIGFEIVQSVDGIIMDQSSYIQELENGILTPQRAMLKQAQLDGKEITLLRQLVGRLNWAVQGSRPDMSFEMIDLSTKLKQGYVADLNRAIKAIRKVKEGEAKVYFPNLGHWSQWRLVLFTDAAHANLSDGVGSTGALLVLLMNNQNKCCPLVWHTHKIKRVVKSTIAAEALSLLEGLENTCYIRQMIQEILGITDTNIPIEAYIDNKSVTEALQSTKLVDDKRLRLDIAAIKELVETRQIQSVRWCPGKLQLADVMTKRGASGYNLLSLIQSGVFIDKYNVTC